MASKEVCCSKDGGGRAHTCMRTHVKHAQTSKWLHQLLSPNSCPVKETSEKVQSEQTQDAGLPGHCPQLWHLSRACPPWLPLLTLSPYQKTLQQIGSSI